MDKTKKTIQEILLLIFTTLGLIGGLYVGGYLMLIKPIATLVIGFQESALTVGIVIIQLIKIFFSSIVGFLILLLGAFLGQLVNQ